MKNRFLFIAVWLVIISISVALITGTYKFLNSLKIENALAIIIVCLLTLLSTSLHLAKRNKEVEDIIDFIKIKVAENHIPTEFYDNYILPTLIKMNNPFTLRKPTLENYFDKQIINQYFS